MKRKKLSMILALLMVFGILASCTNNTTTETTTTAAGETTKAGETTTTAAATETTTAAAPVDSGLSVTAQPDTIIAAMRGEPVLIDPQNQSDMPSTTSCIQVYEPLIMLNPATGEYMPWLAESWEQIDDLTIRFKLREGVKFHNGDELTSEDVMFTLERGKASSKKAWVFRPFDPPNSEIIDKYTIDIRTEEPFAAALSFLANNGSLIVSKSAVEAAASVDEYGQAPNGGTGPWKFNNWVAGDSVTYDRNDDYWGEKAAFAKMILRNITDDTTRALSLESGDIDMCIDVAPAQIENVKASGRAEVFRAPSYVTAYLCFNVKKDSPWKDVRVRQALRWAMDLDSMVSVAFPGVGTPADGPYPKSIAVATDAEGDLAYGYDLEKAKALMAEAGYPDGFEMNFWTNENQSRIDMGEMLQNAWAQIGVTLNVEIMEFATLLELLDTGGHDIFMMGWVLGGNDGDFIHDLFHTTLGFENNRPGYENKEFDRMVDAARVSMDQDERNELYSQIQDLLRAELPWIPVQHGEAIYGLRSTLKDVDVQPEMCTRIATIRPK